MSFVINDDNPVPVKVTNGTVAGTPKWRYKVVTINDGTDAEHTESLDRNSEGGELVAINVIKDGTREVKQYIFMLPKSS